MGNCSGLRLWQLLQKRLYNQTCRRESRLINNFIINTFLSFPFLFISLSSIYTFIRRFLFSRFSYQYVLSFSISMSSSKVAFLAVLALAGSTFAAPMNGNDGLVQRQAAKINATVTSNLSTIAIPSSTGKASLPTGSVAPVTIAAAATTPTEFKGPGDEASGWPSVDKWVEFEKL